MYQAMSDSAAADLMPAALSGGSALLPSSIEGSNDMTWDIITALAEADQRIVGVWLMRNVAHQAAA